MKRLKNYYNFIKEATSPETSAAPVAAPSESGATPAPVSNSFDGGRSVVLSGKGEKIDVFFGEGVPKDLNYKLPADLKKGIKDSLVKIIAKYQNFTSLINFLGTASPKTVVPKIFLIEVGTSHTGGGTINREVAQARFKVMTDLLIEVLNEKVGGNMSQEKALMLIVDDQTYRPSSTNRNWVDVNKREPSWWERYGRIQVNEFLISGLSTPAINELASKLRKAKGLNLNPDESLIVNAICACQTYDDILALDNNLRGDQKGLQSFLNSTITDGFTKRGSDTAEREKIKNCLNKSSNASGKGDVAQVSNDQITLDLKR